ncbi:MAG TPA: hypothetical protein VFA10_05525 [Ktedonobacteraceae bacterium]|nr:hypothetical protein [Ktedonobacteraceae bacterium]
MSPAKFAFSLQDLHHGWWQAVLSDGIQEVTITASYTPQEPLLPLLWAIRSLLLGADESTCIWWEEPGQYRWLFSRTEKQLHIYIVWFDEHRRLSDRKGEAILRMECDLLAFAKRLAHQLGQLEYQEGKAAVPQEEYQKLKDAITVFEHADQDKHTG